MKKDFIFWNNGLGIKSINRLSDKTKQLAVRALSGEYGREMKKADFFIETTAGTESELNKVYAEVVNSLAETAPLRIIEGEKLIGSATLIEAACHNTPGVNISGTSHVTIGFGSVLKIGYKGLRKKIIKRLKDSKLDNDGKILLEAMLSCLEATKKWHKRYMDLLDRLTEESDGSVKAAYQKLKRNAKNVPENPPENFSEAVQSLWFLYCFQRLCGNWSGVGRIDKILGPYLKKDLQEKRICLDEARELIAHFWIKGSEWAGADSFGSNSSGDAQFYQNIILGGVDDKGQDITNEVTFLVLDVVEELHISDFPIAVRVNRQTPDLMMRRIAELQRLGGGIVAIYNEELILKALTDFGYELKEARDFSNDGCWEVIIQGKTAFTYLPFDMLQLLQESVGLDKNWEKPKDDYQSFDELYEFFLTRLRKHVGDFHQRADYCFDQGNRQDANRSIPTPLLSMFVDGCIAKAKSYNNRGAKYTVAAIHAGGMPEVANSLTVIKRLVFEEKRMTWQDFKKVLEDNWQGHEKLRRQIISSFILYGNDQEEADKMLQRVYNDYLTIAGKVKKRKGVLRPVGISTFGREIQYRHHRKATSFGSFAGEVLSTNLAPTPGTDKCGPTAVIKSFSKLDFSKLTNGVPLELKIMPSSVKGENGLKNLININKTFLNLGGFYLHIDVVDNAMLKDAQKHPEKYPNLSVRLSGWSARFATLNKEWQDMVIQRTQQAM